MSSDLPDGFVPYVTSTRRFYWRKQCERTREEDDLPAAIFKGRRLAESGTSLPTGFPSRALLIDAGVLAVEEVQGAGPVELRSYGLNTLGARALIFFLEGFTMTTFGYGPRIGQFYEEDEVEILASAARTTSTTSDTYEIGDKGTLNLDLAITAASGTAPSLHVQIETREAYSSGTWRVVEAFPIQTSTATLRRSAAGCDRFVRAVCTIAGTNPSFTFALSGRAV